MWDKNKSNASVPFGTANWKPSFRFYESVLHGQIRIRKVAKIQNCSRLGTLGSKEDAGNIRKPSGLN